MEFLADAPVWVDYFIGRTTPQTDYLDSLLGRQRVLMGDLVLAEVLQGFMDERQREIAEDALRRFPVVVLGGESMAVKAARNARVLRSRGEAVPSMVDCLLATFCAERGVVLLSHRDFSAFERHLGLRCPRQEG